jgi:hypothetical protein
MKSIDFEYGDKDNGWIGTDVASSNGTYKLYSGLNNEYPRTAKIVYPIHNP